MPKFSWDRKKAVANLRNHGVNFETAMGVFDDPFALDDIDDREDNGEERSNIIDLVEGRILFVTYALRGGDTPIQRSRRKGLALQSNARKVLLFPTKRRLRKSG